MMTTNVDFGELQYGWELAYQHQDTEQPLWQEAAIPVIDDAIELLRSAGARSVVDLGCGDGRNLAALVAAGFSCMGVDIAPTGLAHARTTAQPAFLLRADATDIGLIDNSVDAVTCFDVFGQIQDPSSLVREARRILRPGGTLVVNAFTPEDGTYGEGEEIAPHTFAYKDTLFRYYDEDSVRELFSEWEITSLYRRSWDDPPHGDFRPYPHRHDNWIVLATPR
ncbi:class I SAM-dependent methyltransferase [Nocardiopsis gilva]|nr:class I SAM-dependent methyltransferase [Nocardiopsis gilva]